MEMKHLPVIDWELSIKLAGNKKDLAQDMLNMLVKTLANDILSIKQSYQHNDSLGLLRHVHRLHGALCYCGLPRLRTVLHRMEQDLKQNITANLPILFQDLDKEVQLFLQCHSQSLAAS